MKRLTDRKVAAELKRNVEELQAAGIEPTVSDLRYIKLAKYENLEDKFGFLFFSFLEYSITKAYGDHRHGVLHFVSNGLDFVVYSYFADRDLVPVDEWGMQDAAD